MRDKLFDEFGLTNNREYFDMANKYREDAISDGWTATATYGDGEPIERHATLEKDGFKMHIMAREGAGRYKYQASVTIWGPDRLQVRPPDKYDWQYIKDGIRRCCHCLSIGETFQAGFAGRYCAKCIPEQKRIQEYPGWTR